MSSAIGRDLKARNGNFNFDVQVWVKFFSSLLEGRVEEHTRGFGELRDIAFETDTKVDRFRQELAARIDGLDQKVDRFRDELSARMDGLDQKVDRFRDELSARIDGLNQKVDRFRDELSARIDGLDQKVDRFRDELSARLDALDQKVDRLFGALDHKMSRQCLWILGVQVTILIAVVGALVAS